MILRPLTPPPLLIAARKICTPSSGSSAIGSGAPLNGFGAWRPHSTWSPNTPTRVAPAVLTAAPEPLPGALFEPVVAPPLPPLVPVDPPVVPAPLAPGPVVAPGTVSPDPVVFPPVVA